MGARSLQRDLELVFVLVTHKHSLRAALQREKELLTQHSSVQTNLLRTFL